MPEATVYTKHRVRLLAPNLGTFLFPVYARSWHDALVTLQVILLTDGIRTSRRD